MNFQELLYASLGFTSQNSHIYLSHSLLSHIHAHFPLKSARVTTPVTTIDFFTFTHKQTQHQDLHFSTLKQDATTCLWVTLSSTCGQVPFGWSNIVLSLLRQERLLSNMAKFISSLSKSYLEYGQDCLTESTRSSLQTWLKGSWVQSCV